MNSQIYNPTRPAQGAPTRPARGFSLIETVIAIGVVAVLLSGFLIVFAPAAAGIKESINSKAATRLVNTLEQELVSLRGADQRAAYATGFEKAYDYIKESAGSDPDNAILVYKYRASLSATRVDGTPEPVNDVDGLSPGEDYVVRNMMRRKGDREFLADIPAIDGPVYLVKCTQLILVDAADDEPARLEPATAGKIANEDEPAIAVDDPDGYNHAVVAFVADFYNLPSRGATFLIRASPSNTSRRIYSQPRSNSHFFIENLAELAYAWWLLCSSSPPMRTPMGEMLRAASGLS